MRAKPGMKRATWTRPLAESLGYKNPQDMRDELAELGLRPPYVLEQVLNALDSKGHSTVAFRKQLKKADEKKPKKNANAGTAMVVLSEEQQRRKEIGEKISAAANRRLIPRLARVLNDDSPSGRAKVRRMLDHFNIKHDDEHRAVTLLKERGVDLSKFEYADPENRPVELPPLNERQIALIIERHIREHPSYWLIGAAEKARQALAAWEKQMRLGAKLELVPASLPRPHHLVQEAIDHLRAPPWDEMVAAARGRIE